MSIRAAWVCDNALHYPTGWSVYLWKDTAAVNRFIAACFDLPLMQKFCVTTERVQYSTFIPLISQVYYTVLPVECTHMEAQLHIQSN